MLNILQYKHTILAASLQYESAQMLATQMYIYSMYIPNATVSKFFTELCLLIVWGCCIGYECIRGWVW